MTKSNEPPRKALGRGLSALLPPRTEAASTGTATAQTKLVDVLPILTIRPNPKQPRVTFHDDSLAELAASIKANGVIQPLVVQQDGDHYLLIAGERRWRAAQIAGLTEVPVVVRDYAPDRILEIALIENIQREDLNPIEVAEALARLVDDHHLTHEQVAERTGKDRASVTNLLRLLRLTQPVQQMVIAGQLALGHARALLAIDEEATQIDTAITVVTEGLSVRATEQLVKKAKKLDTLIANAGQPQDQEKPDVPVDPNVKAAVEELERHLGTRVRLVPKTDERGRLEIEYYSKAELQRLYELFTGN